MNREILFRGKRIDNGEWIIGDLTTYTDIRGQKIYEILDKNNLIDIYIPSVLGDLPTQMPAFINVDETTIGQFTGLYDKNGTKIFEGDIVKIVGDSNNDDWKDVNYVAQIVFIDGGFCAIDGTPSNHSFRRYGLSRCEFDLEVVGNIHDNPELLGE